jgi:hypothetical protein
MVVRRVVWYGDTSPPTTTTTTTNNKTFIISQIYTNFFMARLDYLLLFVGHKEICIYLSENKSFVVVVCCCW